MSEKRKQRVHRLKRYIILSVLLLILIPCVLSLVLFGKMKSQRKELDIANDKLQQLILDSENTREQLLDIQEQIKLWQNQTPEQTKSEQTGKPQKESEDAQATHKVYLTFDDGPSSYTNDILDILQCYDVKATFFVLGKEKDSAKEAMKRIVEEGHTLGMHSYSHKYKEIYRSVEDFSADFERIRQLLIDVTGVDSKFYRFPGGSSNKVSDVDMHQFTTYLQEQGIVYFDWNAASGDGENRLWDADTLIENSLKGIEKRETTVLLLHDSVDKRTTVEALPRLIENIMAMEDTVILPITESTTPVQHIRQKNE